MEARRAEEFFERFLRHGDGLDVFVDHLHRALADDLADGALQAAHTRLQRIAANQAAHHLVADADAFRRQPVLLDLPGQQVPLGDIQLFILSIAADLDQLHAVEQRARNGIHRVGCGNEHHAGKIERRFQIVIAESVVLRAVEHFKHRARRIAAHIGGHFVDFVKQEDRVHRPRLLDGRNDPPRNRADIRSAMAANLRLVAHAAQRHLNKLAPERAGDALGDGRFAHARRADEAEHRPLHVVFDAAYGQIFDDALLHLVQPVVILGQNPARTLEIEVIRRGLAPRQIEQPFDIGSADPDFRASGRHAAQAFQFAVRLIARLVVHRRLGQPFAQILNVRRVLVAQLGLNRLDLLPQEIILLILLNLLADARLNLLLHARQFGFAHEQRADGFQPRQLVKFLEHLLTILDLAEHVGRNDIRQLARILDFQNRLHGLSGNPAAHLTIFLKIMVRRAQQRVRFDGNRRSLFEHFIQRAHKVRLFLRHRAQNRAAFALHEQANVSARQTKHLLDAGNGAHMINIINGRVIHIHIALRDQKNALVFLHGLIERRNGFLAPRIKMQNHMREDHQPAQRQHRQADRLRVFLFRLSQCLFPPLSALFS